MMMMMMMITCSVDWRCCLSLLSVHLWQFCCHNNLWMPEEKMTWPNYKVKRKALIRFFCKTSRSQKVKIWSQKQDMVCMLWDVTIAGSTRCPVWCRLCGFLFDLPSNHTSISFCFGDIRVWRTDGRAYGHVNLLIFKCHYSPVNMRVLYRMTITIASSYIVIGQLISYA